jgi:hypothetical protein
MFVRFSGQGTPQVGAVGVEPTHPQAQGLSLLRLPVTPRAYSQARTVNAVRAMSVVNFVSLHKFGQRVFLVGITPPWGGCRTPALRESPVCKLSLVRVQADC